MNRRPDHKGRKRTLVLSDILQSGDTDKDLYNKVAFLCEKRGVEKFIGIGEGLLAQRSAFKHLGESISLLPLTPLSTAMSSLTCTMR